MIDKIKEQDLLNFVRITTGQKWKKEMIWYRFNSWEEKTPSLLVYNDKNKWYCDYSGRLWAGTIIDFYMNFYNCNQKEAIQSLKQYFKLEDEKKVFKKQPKREELFTNFKDYQNFDINYLNYFLQKRWLTFEQTQTYKPNILKIHSEIWFVSGLFIKTDTYKDTIIFPCYNHDFLLKWVKLRTTDLSKFWEVKSLAVNSTGLLYNPWELNNDQIIICEGEIDYMILKIIWFTSVIWNLGWVQSNIESIKILTKECKELVSFYDNDKAWREANIKLIKELWRDIICVKYPTEDKVDINDLFNRWFCKKEDFEKMIKNWSKEKEIYKINQKEDWYYFLKWDFFIRATDFLLEAIEFLQVDEEKKIVFNIKHNTWEFKETFSSKDFCDVLSFKKKIRKTNPFCNFFDIKADVLDEIIRYVLRDKEAVYTYIVEQKWYIKQFNCWSFREGIIYNWKFYKYWEDKTVNLWRVKIKLENEDNYYLPTYEKENYDINIIKHFEHMFWQTNWELVLWFLVSSLFVNSVHFTAFPILFIFWKKGTWKTTAIENALKILWIDNSKNIAESDTRFVDEYNTGRISSLPYWSDEYKNWKRTKEKETFYKTIYDRSWVSRWHIQDNILWTQKINYLSTLILSWEQSPNDDAVFSRTCLIEVSKDRQWDIYEEIQEQSKKYPYIIKKIIENFDELKDLFIFLIEQVKEILKQKGVKDRLLDVYVPIISWYLLYNNFFNKNDEISEDFIKRVIEKITEKKEKESEDILDSFFNKVFYLFEKNNYIDYRDHIKVNNNIININFPYIYSMYEDNSKKEDMISKKDLKNYLEKEYKTKRSSMKKLDNTWIWNNTISFELIKWKYPKIFDDYFNINL